MEYMTTNQAAQKWGVSLRWVQMYLKDGRIDGAFRFGRDWMIPQDATKPKDERVKSGKYATDTAAIPKTVPEIVSIGAFTFDLVSCLVFFNGEDLGVRQKECDVLYFLMQHENKTFSHEEIYARAWGKKTGCG